VLIESAPSGGGLWLAVGIGVNLASAPRGGGPPRAPALGAHLKSGVARPPNLEEALAALAKAFDRWSAVWHEQGFTPIREAWTEAAAGLGGPLRRAGPVRRPSTALRRRWSLTGRCVCG
jgi:BirA family biotin operon repressor/biotin-[acetyl-CoA-carboxylase] ligase